MTTPLVRYLRAGPTLSFGFEFSPTEGDKSTNETPPSIETMQDKNTRTKHGTDENVFENEIYILYKEFKS